MAKPICALYVATRKVAKLMNISIANFVVIYGQLSAFQETAEPLNHWSTQLHTSDSPQKPAAVKNVTFAGDRHLAC